MAEDYRERLFSTYNETHVVHVDASDQVKLAWFRQYAHRHYLPHLSQIDRAGAHVLDIGCNKGYLLAVMAEAGFQHLYGVDLSPLDLQIAKRIAPRAELLCGDAHDYLAGRPDQFDLVIIKAVIEHLPKQETLPMLEAIQRGLKPGGIVLVDVPNMDWLFATHERYMDFTHEAGFTPESLRQVLCNVFAQVQVIPLDSTGLGRSALFAIRNQVSRFVLGKLLAWADPEGGSLPIWSRSLLGIGVKESR
jgi:2-polyprenyl-3-methyl-5-hydroxy-6-metoxy-1,4-benzoquinol methylase